MAGAHFTGISFMAVGWKDLGRTRPDRGSLVGMLWQPSGGPS